MTLAMKDRVEQVGYATCGANNKSGGQCRKPAGWGTNHFGFGRCRLHGGSTPTHVKAAQKLMLRGAAQALDLTDLEHIAPGVALMDEVARCRKMVEWLSDQVRHLEQDEITGLMVSKVTDANGVERTVGQNILLRALGEWSDRLVRVSKVTHEAGIEERQVRLAEQQTQLIADVIYNTLVDLGIEVDNQVIDVVGKHLLPIGEI